MDEIKLIQDIEAVMREAGDIILSAKRSDEMTDAKSGHANFVTVYDRRVQTFLEEKLLAILPEAVFVGEEDEAQSSIDKGLAFVVDPIDGTTNFIKDYRASCISVGLLKDGRRYIGLVYQPYCDEMYTAIKGQGAYLNGQRIQVSDCCLKDSLVVFGTSPYYEELRDRSMSLACDFLKRAIDIRRSGSAAIDLCAVAAGRVDLYFELRLSPWDYAAAALIASEAGASVSTTEYTELKNGIQTGVLAANPVAYEEARSIFI